MPRADRGNPSFNSVILAALFLPVDAGAEAAAAAGGGEVAGVVLGGVGGGDDAVAGAVAEAEVPAEAAGAVGLVPEVVLQGERSDNRITILSNKQLCERD